MAGVKKMWGQKYIINHSEHRQKESNWQEKSNMNKMSRDHKKNNNSQVKGWISKKSLIWVRCRKANKTDLDTSTNCEMSTIIYSYTFYYMTERYLMSKTVLLIEILTIVC